MQAVSLLLGGLLHQVLSTGTGSNPWSWLYVCVLCTSHMTLCYMALCQTCCCFVGSASLPGGRTVVLMEFWLCCSFAKRVLQGRHA